MRIRCGPLIAAIGAALVLAGCAFSQAETPRQRAYALGVEYAAVQEAAIAYVEHGDPSPEVALGIKAANGVAAGLVKATISQAMRTEMADAAVENEEAVPTELGSGSFMPDAESVAGAQSSGFERLFSLAKSAVGRLAAMIGGA